MELPPSASSSPILCLCFFSQNLVHAWLPHLASRGTDNTDIVGFFCLGSLLPQIIQGSVTT